MHENLGLQMILFTSKKFLKIIIKKKKQIEKLHTCLDKKLTIWVVKHFQNIWK